MELQDNLGTTPLEQMPFPAMNLQTVGEAPPEVTSQPEPQQSQMQPQNDIQRALMARESTITFQDDTQPQGFDPAINPEVVPLEQLVGQLGKPYEVDPQRQLVDGQPDQPESTQQEATNPYDIESLLGLSKAEETEQPEQPQVQSDNPQHPQLVGMQREQQPAQSIMRSEVKIKTPEGKELTAAQAENLIAQYPAVMQQLEENAKALEDEANAFSLANFEVPEDLDSQAGQDQMSRNFADFIVGFKKAEETKAKLVKTKAAQEQMQRQIRQIGIDATERMLAKEYPSTRTDEGLVAFYDRLDKYAQATKISEQKIRAMHTDPAWFNLLVKAAAFDQIMENSSEGSKPQPPTAGQIRPKATGVQSKPAVSNPALSLVHLDGSIS